MAVREYKPALSDAECDRRWGLVRAKLRELNLDGLLVYGHTLPQLASNFQYLSQIWGKDGGSMLIFPAEGEPHMVLPAYGGAARMASSWVAPENVRSTVMFNKDVIEEVKAMGLERARLGVDRLSVWPAADYKLFTELCPGAELVDVGYEFYRLRSRKSEEELALISDAISVAKLSHERFISTLKPGGDCAEAVAAAEGVLIANGVSRDRIILTHNAPEMVYPYTPRRETLRRDRPVALSTEYAMIAGGGCQVIRTYAWDEPKAEQKRMFELNKALRELVMRSFRPGRELTAAGAEIIRLVEDAGFSSDKLGHSCGVTYGELPFITGGPGQLDYMEWTIQEDEVFIVHPMIRNKDGGAPFVWLGDMFYVGKKSTELMTDFYPETPVMLG